MNKHIHSTHRRICGLGFLSSDSDSCRIHSAVVVSQHVVYWWFQVQACHTARLGAQFLCQNSCPVWKLSLFETSPQSAHELHFSLGGFEIFMRMSCKQPKSSQQEAWNVWSLEWLHLDVQMLTIRYGFMEFALKIREYINIYLYLCVFHVFPFRLHGLKEFLVFGLGLVARRQQRAAPTAQAEIRQMFQLSNLIKGSFDTQTS